MDKDLPNDIIEIHEENSSDSDIEDASQEYENKYLFNRQNNKKGTKLHTIESKIKIIKYAKETSQKEAANKFMVATSTLNDWMKKKKNI